MKLKRFIAKDMRTALNNIKEELGADAVIMSNKRLDNGSVEIVAGIEESQVEDLFASLEDDSVTLSSKKSNTQKIQNKNTSKTTATKSSATKRVNTTNNNSSSRNNYEFAKSLIEILERQSKLKNDNLDDEAKQRIDNIKKSAPLTLEDREEFSHLFKKSKDKEEKEAYEKQNGINTYKESESTENLDNNAFYKEELTKMKEEVASIRKLLQFELSGLINDRKVEEEPVRAMLSKLLVDGGFSKKISEALVSKVSPDASFNFAWRELLKVLEDSIVLSKKDLIDDGGVICFIGPSGVGKTTTLAKIAARYVMKYGSDSLALITCDNFRIGAVEQIKTYGRIMGCENYALKSILELPLMLSTLKDKSLVLVDTAGVGFKDERFGTQLAQLKMQDKLKLKHVLVLPASSQRRTLTKAYNHFSAINLSGLVLTKVDECQSLGDAISLNIAKKLPICYLTDGQRVPEDLKMGDPHEIAFKTLQIIEEDAHKDAQDEFDDE